MYMMQLAGVLKMDMLLGLMMIKPTSISFHQALHRQSLFGIK